MLLPPEIRHTEDGHILISASEEVKHPAAQFERWDLAGGKVVQKDALRAADGLPGRLRYLPIAAASWLSAWLRGARPSGRPT